MDRAADEIDRASEISEEHNQECIQHYSRLARPEQERDEAGNWQTEECVDCGEPIGEVRLELGKLRCISCQELVERRNRMYVR